MKILFNISLLFILCCLNISAANLSEIINTEDKIFSHESNTEKYDIYRLSASHRSKTLQEAINIEFDKVKNSSGYGLYTGSTQEDYSIFGTITSHYIIEKAIVDHANETTPLYIIDVGSGEGGWGKGAFAFIKTEYDNPSSAFRLKKLNSDVVILSLTGEKKDGEPGGKSLSINLGEHKLSYLHYEQFAIENLITELKKQHGYDLQNQVSLVVSHKALCHLVDPLGTLDQMYNLLIPQKGYLLSDGGFIYLPEDTHEYLIDVRYMDDRWAKALMSSNASVLFHGKKHILMTRNVPLNFIIFRPDEQPLGIKLRYCEKTAVGQYYQLISGDKQSRALYEAEYPSQFSKLSKLPRLPTGSDDYFGEKDLNKNFYQHVVEGLKIKKMHLIPWERYFFPFSATGQAINNPLEKPKDRGTIDAKPLRKNARRTVYAAVVANDIKAVESLIFRKAGLEAKDSQGFTPLIKAASNNRLEITRLLLNANADIEAQNVGGYTALGQATFNGHGEMIKLLVACGANLFVQAKNGETIADIAKRSSRANRDEIIKLIASETANKTKEPEARTNKIKQLIDDKPAQTTQAIPIEESFNKLPYDQKAKLLAHLIFKKVKVTITIQADDIPRTLIGQTLSKFGSWNPHTPANNLIHIGNESHYTRIGEIISLSIDQ